MLSADLVKNHCELLWEKFGDVGDLNDKELKTEYIRNKSFNDLHFKDMIIQYLRSFGGATRAELNTLLQSKLSDVLTEEQKIRKIGNMLSALKKQGVIKLTEKKKWVLVEV